MTVGLRAEQWLRRYAAQFPTYRDAASLAKEEIADALAGYVHGVHNIEARAKDPDSVMEKTYRKGYGQPWRQFDDLVGVRVTLLNDNSVATVGRRLRHRFWVEESRSSNKTAGLRLHEVGYRSDHVVLKCRGETTSPHGRLLHKTFVEVQVRSVLAHAWAEIEHSLRYKAGDGIPPELARRFDTLAGTLELVDREFSNIESDIVELVGARTEEYRLGRSLDDPLSSIQLLAGLAADRDTMEPLGPHHLKLDIEDSFRLAKELNAVGVANVADLQGQLSSAPVLEAIRHYSEGSLTDIDPGAASGIVVIGCIIGVLDVTRFRRTRLFTQDAVLSNLFQP